VTTFCYANEQSDLQNGIHDATRLGAPRWACEDAS
jgi:hypothetical protein